MKTIIEKYEEMMKANGKDLKVILAEKISSPFADEQHLLLSETDKEWIIHPAILLKNGEVSTGNGTYLFKKSCSYHELKRIFDGRK
jgi:hypothetical protein